MATPNEEVNFEVAPEGNKATYPDSSTVKQTERDIQFYQTMKKKGMKMMSKKVFEKVLAEMKCQDEKMTEVDRSIAVTVKMLEEQLTKGIQVTKLQ